MHPPRDPEKVEKRVLVGQDNSQRHGSECMYVEHKYWMKQIHRDLSKVN